MIFYIEEDLDEQRSIDQSSEGDTILVGTIKQYNRIVSALTEKKPGIMIYVRIRDWKYWPRILYEEEK